MNINWKGQVTQKKNLYFEDLKLNESFKNAGYSSRGAVYIKVATNDGIDWMYEVATGLLFKPTKAPVQRVEVELNISVEKPDLYK
jgi:hypothetical protein